MDAKPQKPVRGFRVHGDENVVPSLPGHKTLHSRNKSSPALSTMATAGLNKIPAKRAAFGDVSNTAHGNRPVKDDLLNLGKPSTYEAKDNVPQQLKGDTKASTALLRPAQRLLVSANTFKNTSIGNVAAPAALSALQKSAVEPGQQPASTANTRKTLIKRSTTVFRDYSTAPQPHQDAVDLSKPLPPVRNESIVHQQPSTSELSDGKPADRHVRKVQSTYSVAPSKRDSIKLEDVRPTVESVPTRPLPKAEPAYPCHQEHDYKYESDAQLASLMARVETSVSVQEPIHMPPPDIPCAVPVTSKQYYPVMESKEPLATVGEPEEYWDDEEDDENYDEEGYVTARSFKSRSENVTGNATTILVPRTSHRVRKEVEAARILVESMKSPEEIEDEAWDTSMVAEYGDEIFDYMHELEARLQPNPHYMDVQTEIQWSMRSVLMDWLVQVHHRFQLLPETLFLCVNYIDRFLSFKVVSLGKLQLVGATAIFVAAKYEEINCPSVNEIVYMVDGGYSIDEILKAERFMLSMLQFELGWPGPMSFLRRISKADDYDLETRTLAKYFLEITIMDERFLGCPPSFTAAGAHCLARMMLGKGSWTPHHVYYSGYTYAQLHSLLHLMVECCEDPSKHHAAIYDKYQDKRYKCASRFVATEMQKGFQVPDVSANNAQTFMSFYDTAPWPADRPHYY